ncbi:hypothetical protein AAT17_12135 [Nonlabens sp. MIC269]|uniref:hypothetical protein n=1 Tax=Nonlabens sp. MIC269 TaxID=1476901 RepID=UPI00072090F3|nr:hypothetical protein [Nonlabens sp. MIC269]ALM21931.1 hypothetical protein AAT17_12135 [Nonlabens sp. MIC269]
MIKTSNEITIHKPIDEVMKLFKEQDYFQHWQKGLISFKNLSSQTGQVGSKRSMRIKTSVATISMIEEITQLDLPHLWAATYRTRGVVNEQCNRFRESVIKNNNSQHRVTLWQASSTFKFTGMMRLAAKANPKVFTSQTLQHMQDFKIFAETGKSVKTGDYVL